MKEVVILSGKGGTGKTSVTAGLAAYLDKTVLADCDVDAADMHLLLAPEPRVSVDFSGGSVAVIDPLACTSCGVCAASCRFGAIEADFSVRAERCEGCGVCEFVCENGAATLRPRISGERYVSSTRLGTMAHARLHPGEENSGKLVTAVRQSARETAEAEGAEIILVDGPPGIGCPVIASLGGTDLVVAVTEPTTTAMSDLERLYGLTNHFDIALMVIINKSGVNERRAVALAAWCRERGVQVAGMLPYDRAFTDAQRKRRTVAEHDPQGLGSLLSGIAGTIHDRLAGATEPEHRTTKGDHP